MDGLAQAFPVGGQVGQPRHPGQPDEAGERDSDGSDPDEAAGQRAGSDDRELDAAAPCTCRSFESARSGYSPDVPDICDLILDDHEVFRRRFAELDDERHSTPEVVSALWEVIAEHLERHAAAEEEVFYPAVLDRTAHGEHEAHHAIRDHNKIRDALRTVAAASPGSDEWWAGVDAANEENSDHMAEEERGPLSDLRQAGLHELRRELGAAFVSFNLEHAGGRELDIDDVDPDTYVEEHAGG